MSGRHAALTTLHLLYSGILLRMKGISPSFLAKRTVANACVLVRVCHHHNSSSLTSPCDEMAIVWTCCRALACHLFILIVVGAFWDSNSVKSARPSCGIRVLLSPLEFKLNIVDPLRRGLWPDERGDTHRGYCCFRSSEEARVSSER